MIQESEESIFGKLTPQSVILNQCNTKGWLGTGIQSKIHSKYPQSYNDYRQYCGWFQDGHEKEIIGTWARTKINENLIVCNAIVQFSTHKNRSAIDFDAWRDVLKKLEHQTRYVNKHYGTDWTIHVPEKICGSSPTNCEYIKALFHEYFDESPVKVVFHKY